jgi:hypothetical protein
MGKSILLIPFAGVFLCQSALASRVSAKLTGVAISAIAPVFQIAKKQVGFDPFATLQPPTAAVVVPVTEGEEDDEVLSPLDATSDGSVIASPKPKPQKKPNQGASSKTKPLPSVRVPASVVLRLARIGQRPSGVPVAASGNRPAGIQVFGAAPLGIGVRDGDILTRVSGVPVSQVGQVIALVIAARGTKAREITGQLWRGNRSYTIVVEQPYLREGETPTKEPAQVPTKEPAQVPSKEPAQVPSKEPAQVPSKEPA